MPATPRTILKQDFAGEIRFRFLFPSFLHTFYFAAIGICVARISPLQRPSIRPDVVLYRHSKMCSRSLALLVLAFQRELNLPTVSQCSSNSSISVRNTCNFMISNTSRRCQLGSGIRSELRRNDWEIAPDVSWNSSGPHSRDRFPVLATVGFASSKIKSALATPQTCNLQYNSVLGCLDRLGAPLLYHLFCGRLIHAPNRSDVADRLAEYADHLNL
jgi:hypothetical protein